MRVDFTAYHCDEADDQLVFAGRVPGYPLQFVWYAVICGAPAAGTGCAGTAQVGQRARLLAAATARERRALGPGASGDYDRHAREQAAGAASDGAPGAP